MDIAKQRVINMAGYNVSDGHVIVCLYLSIKKVLWIKLEWILLRKCKLKLQAHIIYIINWFKGTRSVINNGLFV